MADVITVEPDADEASGPPQAPDPGADVAPARPGWRRRPSRWTLRMAGLGMAFAVLVTADALLYLGPGEVAAQREPALAAARQVALDISSLGAENAPERLARLDATTTGAFREDLRGYGALLQDMLRQGRVTSEATVTAAGLERIDAESTVALVAVSATVADAAAPGGEQRRYRLAIELRRDGGRWLASSVAYVT